jgi:alcohol dehydrogenase
VVAEVVRGPGSFGDVGGSLAGSECVILGGQTSFEASGAAVVAKPLVEAGGRLVQVRGPLPTTEEVDRAVAEIGDDRPATLVAVGGGLVIDVMKVVGLSLATERTAGEIIAHGADTSGGFPWTVAAPTTAGSGAERTPFAVMYQDGVKHSIDDSRLLPSRAVLDPTLSRSAPKPVAAAAALDAMAHCVESIWACRSTPQSQAVASDALLRLSANVEAGVVDSVEGAREELLYASSDAGAAIATTRTTAAHALSYHLTSEHHIAHGHAVALTLGLLASYNEAVDESSVTDTRGVDHVRSAVSTACRSFGVPDGAQLTNRLRELMESMGLPSRVDAAAGHTVDRELWVSAVNPERLGNNPRRLSHADLLDLVEEA